MQLLPSPSAPSLPAPEWHGGLAEIHPAVEQLNATKSPVPTSAPQKPSWFRRWSGGIVLSWLLLVVLGGALRLLPLHDDLLAYHFPLRHFYQQCLINNVDWQWCPALFAGYYLHGEGQIGGDHPLHQFLYRLLPLQWAFSVEMWWPYLAIVSGTYVWLRQLRLGVRASAWGALTLAGCGCLTLRIVHMNATQVIAHFPWLLACQAAWLRSLRNSARPLAAPPRTWLLSPQALLAAIALLTGSQLLLGYPQYVIYSLIVEGISLVWLGRRFASGSRIKLWKIYSAYAAAKLLGLLIGAAQVLPTLDYLLASERATWTAADALNGSWHPLNVVQLIAPYLLTTRVVGQNTHELTSYLGVIPLFLAVTGIWCGGTNRATRGLRLLGWTLVVTGTLIALGEHGPLRLVLPYVPLVNYLRFPSRAMVIAMLGLVIFSALGLRRLLQAACAAQQGSAKPPASETSVSNNGQLNNKENTPAQQQLSWAEFCAAADAPPVVSPTTLPNSLWWIYAALVAVSLGLIVMAQTAWSTWAAPVEYQVLGPALAILSVILIGNAAQGAPFAFRTLELVMLCDVGLYAGLHYWQKFPESSAFHHPRPLLLTDQKARDQWLSYQDAHAIASDGFLVNLPATWHKRINVKSNDPQLSESNVRGYAGVAPRRQLDYQTSELAAQLAGYDPRRWQILADTVPPANLIEQVYVSDSAPGELLKRVDFGKVAIVDANEFARLLSVEKLKLSLGEIFPVDRAIDRLRFKREAVRQPQIKRFLPAYREFIIPPEAAAARDHDYLLVTTESYHPGWRGTCDGRPVPVVRANGDYLACGVPAGGRQVTLEFAPWSHTLGRWLSLFGLGLCAALLVLTLFCRNSAFPAFVISNS
ncbi:MAG: hypothetical protein SFX18_08585 [Pirellulales bacterium]|nr:hypothetical protein [Pirellulales bacterium]